MDGSGQRKPRNAPRCRLLLKCASRKTRRRGLGRAKAGAAGESIRTPSLRGILVHAGRGRWGEACAAPRTVGGCHQQVEPAVAVQVIGQHLRVARLAKVQGVGAACGGPQQTARRARKGSGQRQAVRHAWGGGATAGGTWARPTGSTKWSRYVRSRKGGAMELHGAPRACNAPVAQRQPQAVARGGAARCQESCWGSLPATCRPVAQQGGWWDAGASPLLSMT